MNVLLKNLITVALPLCLLNGGCEAVVGDFKVSSCDPEIPKVCADLGDEEDQRIGCCSEDALTIYYCGKSGAITSTRCGDSGRVCDYDPEKDFMACVEN